MDTTNISSTQYSLNWRMNSLRASKSSKTPDTIKTTIPKTEIVIRSYEAFDLRDTCEANLSLIAPLAFQLHSSGELLRATRPIPQALFKLWNTKIMGFSTDIVIQGCKHKHRIQK
jgi:hypothetical protein